MKAAIVCAVILLFAAAPVSAKTVADQAGRNVELPERVSAAAVISVHLEETLTALGVWDRITALPDTCFGNPLIKALKLPEKTHTTFSDSGSFNFETLFRLNPDAVLTWAGNDLLVRRLEEFNIPAITVHPRNLDGLVSMLDILGKTFGKSYRASELVQCIQEIGGFLKSNTPEKPARVLWLGGTQTLVYGSKWIFHDLICKAGGTDVTGDLDFKPWVAELSVEQIVKLNPEVIIIGGWAAYTPEDLVSDIRWQPVSAVQNRRVFKTPSGRANFSPYAALMAIMTARWCHPQSLSAGEAMNRINHYHQIFYGIRFDEVHPEFAKGFLK